MTAPQLHQISTYIDLLLRWNARVNLTSIREPEEIVRRHFGESLFAARHLFPPANRETAAVSVGFANDQQPTTNDGPLDLLDLGSGAGFPGLPIKLSAPELRTTLIESNQRKATFLREVVRTLALTDVEIFSGRAEDFPGRSRTVSLRAVERFEIALPLAASLIEPGGRLALLIGMDQVESARRLIPSFRWSNPTPIPMSTNRILLIGSSD